MSSAIAAAKLLGQKILPTLKPKFFSIPADGINARGFISLGEGVCLSCEFCCC